MLKSLKRHLYFVGARYFAFWAKLVLKRWKPTIIVVTGSAGKTTLLHLIEAQLGKKAHYSHHANSAYGVPFDILGLHGIEESRLEWLGLFIKAPLATLHPLRTQSLYVVEVDADRPREGQFLAWLLQPNITLWVSVLHTHATQFDAVVKQSAFTRPEEAIAAEYGNLIEHTRELVIFNGDNQLMSRQTKRTKAAVKPVYISELKDYQLKENQTEFVFANKQYIVPALLPREVFYQVAMVDLLFQYLSIQTDPNYITFVLPPGRSSVFKGIKNTTLIDSTYNNSNIDSLRGVIEMFEAYQTSGPKWAVVGDMLEQGLDEATEHNKLIEVLENTHFERIILVGPRVIKYVLPLLSHQLRERCNVVAYEEPERVLNDLKLSIQDSETILFKSVRFLEGVIEPLLANKADADKLVRRGRVWQKQRAKWGLQ